MSMVLNFPSVIYDYDELMRTCIYGDTSNIKSIKVKNLNDLDTFPIKNIFPNLESIDVEHSENTTEIGSSAVFDFASENNIKINMLNSNIISMESSPYAGNTTITEDDIYLPTTLKTLNGGFFNGCSSITSLDLSNLEVIGSTNTDNMFKDCTSLTTLTWNWNAIQSYGQYMFQNCSNLQFENDTLYLTNFQISTNIQMGIYAFQNTMIKKIDASNVKSKIWLNNYSFSNCTNLETIDFRCNDSNGDIYLSGSYIFQNCGNLKEMYLYKVYGSFGSMFSGSNVKMDKVETIEIDGRNNYTIAYSLPVNYYAAGSNGNISSWNIKRFVMKNDKSQNLGSWKLHNAKYVSIENCTSLQSFYNEFLRDNTTLSQDNIQFKGLTSLKYLQYFYFYNTNINSFDFMDEATRSAVTSIQNYCFGHTKFTGTLDFGAFPNLQYINNTPFYECNGITEIKFDNCSKLTTIDTGLFTSITNYSTDIKKLSFVGCTSLKNFPDINGLSALEEITFGEVEDISMILFAGLSHITNLDMSMMSVSGGYGRSTMFAGMTSLESLKLPKGLLYFNYGGEFAGCTKLSDIWFYVTTDNITINSNATSGVGANVYNVVLHVPYGHVDYYKNNVANVFTTKTPYCSEQVYIDITNNTMYTDAEMTEEVTPVENNYYTDITSGIVYKYTADGFNVFPRSEQS